VCQNRFEIVLICCRDRNLGKFAHPQVAHLFRSQANPNNPINFGRIRSRSRDRGGHPWRVVWLVLTHQPDQFVNQNTLAHAHTLQETLGRDIGLVCHQALTPLFAQRVWEGAG
jgi:hypothetical protein